MYTRSIKANSVPNRIKIFKIMKHHDWTQEEFGAKLKPTVCQGRVSHWVNPENPDKPSREHQYQIDEMYEAFLKSNQPTVFVQTPFRFLCAISPRDLKPETRAKKVLKTIQHDLTSLAPLYDTSVIFAPLLYGSPFLEKGEAFYYYDDRTDPHLVLIVVSDKLSKQEQQRLFFDELYAHGKNEILGLTNSGLRRQNRAIVRDLEKKALGDATFAQSPGTSWTSQDKSTNSSEPSSIRSLLQKPAVS